MDLPEARGPNSAITFGAFSVAFSHNAKRPPFRCISCHREIDDLGIMNE